MNGPGEEERSACGRSHAAPGGCLGRESSPNSNRVESHSSAEQSNLPRARRILKFVFALGYLVVRRHEPRMYMGCLGLAARPRGRMPFCHWKSTSTKTGGPGEREILRSGINRNGYRPYRSCRHWGLESSKRPRRGSITIALWGRSVTATEMTLPPVPWRR